MLLLYVNISAIVLYMNSRAPVITETQPTRNPLVEAQHYLETRQPWVQDPHSVQVEQPPNQTKLLQNCRNALESMEHGDRLVYAWEFNLRELEEINSGGSTGYLSPDRVTAAYDGDARTSDDDSVMLEPSGVLEGHRAASAASTEDGAAFSKLLVAPDLSDVLLKSDPSPGLSQIERDAMHRAADPYADWVDDPSTPNPILEGIIEATGAVLLRDDLADGTGDMRIYKGMLHGKPVYFEVYTRRDDNIVALDGSTTTQYSRGASALDAGSAKIALNLLSRQEWQLAEALGLPYQGVNRLNFADLIQEKLDKERARHLPVPGLPEPAYPAYPALPSGVDPSVLGSVPMPPSVREAALRDLPAEGGRRRRSTAAARLLRLLVGRPPRDRR